MNTKVRIEFNSSPDFEFASRLGFTTDAIKDGVILKNLNQLGQMAHAGRLRAVPAAATVEQLKESVSVRPGQDAPEGVVAYDAITIYVRVVEVLPGERPGSKATEFEGLDSSNLGAHTDDIL